MCSSNSGWDRCVTPNGCDCFPPSLVQPYKNNKWHIAEHFHTFVSYNTFGDWQFKTKLKEAFRQLNQSKGDQTTGANHRSVSTELRFLAFGNWLDQAVRWIGAGGIVECTQ